MNERTWFSYFKEFMKGLVGGLDEFRVGFPGNVRDLALGWLLGGTEAQIRKLSEILPTEWNPGTLGTFLLKWSGLDVFLQQTGIGARNEWHCRGGGF